MGICRNVIHGKLSCKSKRTTSFKKAPDCVPPFAVAARGEGGGILIKSNNLENGQPIYNSYIPVSVQEVVQLTYVYSIVSIVNKQWKVTFRQELRTSGYVFNLSTKKLTPTGVVKFANAEPVFDTIIPGRYNNVCEFFQRYAVPVTEFSTKEQLEAFLSDETAKVELDAVQKGSN